MATATLGGLFATARHMTPPDTDADLLRRFASARDDTAFAALVSRYGRLVLATCRRIVPDAHLAEDAFQAAFVVLATKAGSLDTRRPLGPWLYGVARHVATRARDMIGRRRKRETLTGTLPDQPRSSGTGFPACADEAAILDEEIARLSPAYRDAVILCEMQGLSRKDAAKKLGISEGTLSSRLAAARKRLAERLRARGVVGGIAVASTVSVSTDLVAATVAACNGSAELSPHVGLLVKGGLAMTLLSKLKLGTALLALVAVLVGLGGWGTTHPEAAAAPVPKATQDDGLIWTHHTGTNLLTAYAPNGKKAKEVKLPAEATFIGLMPDGARMMFVGMKGKPPLPNADGPLTLHVGEIDAKCEGVDTGLGWQLHDQFIWSPDGKQVVRSRRVANGERPLLTFQHTLFDLATKKETPVRLPARHELVQWSADGTTWRVMHYNRAVDPKLPTYRWLSMPVGGGDLTPVCDAAAFLWLDPHPDGKRFLVAPVEPADVSPGAFTLATVADGKLDKLANVPAEVDGVVCADARWSPDGKRMAALWYGIGTERQTLGNTVLAVFDGIGKDKQVLFTVTADGQRTRLLGWFPTKPVAALPKRNAPVPKAGTDPGLLWTHHRKDGKLVAYTPDGKTVREVKIADGPAFLGLSGDGTKILFAGKNGKPGRPPEEKGLTLHVRDLDADTGTDLGLPYQPNDQFVFSPDGKQVVRTRIEVLAQNRSHIHSNILFDLATKKETDLKLPAEQQVCVWSDDGKEWWVLQYNDDRKLPVYRWHRYPVAGGPSTPICDAASLMWVLPMPGQQTLLGVGHPFPADKPAFCNLLHLDPASGKARQVTAFEKLAFASIRRSPSGHRVAVMKYDWDANQQRKENDTHLVLLDPDGTNEVKLHTYQADGQQTQLLGWFPTPKPAAPAPKRNTPVPKVGPPPEGVILVGRTSHQEPGRVLEAMDAAGKSLGYLPVGELLNVRQARVSPDGKKLAFVRFIPLQGNDPNARGKYYYPESVYVVDLPLTEPPAAPVIAAALDPTIAWDADGKTLIVSRIADGVNVSQEAIAGKVPERATVRLDATTKKETALKLPEGHAVEDVSPDGKTLLTRIKVWNGGFAPIAYSSFLVPLDTMKAKQLGDEDDGFERARFSPDGTRVAGIRVELTKSKETGLFVADVATGKIAAVRLPKEMDADKLNGVAWAPDAKRLAVLWRGAVAGRPGIGAGGGARAGARADAFRIAVMDATGANAKTIREFAADDYQYQIEWADPKLPAEKPAAPPKK